MEIGKFECVRLFSSIFQSVDVAVRGGLQDYQKTLSDRQKIRLGPRLRADWVQREALASMREDPAVTARFVAAESRQLHGLVLRGEEDSPDIALLFNKATRWNDRLYTARQRTDRHADRRRGTVSLFSAACVPVIFFWEFAWPDNPLLPQIARIGMGEERGSFLWSHTISDARGNMNTRIVDEQPLLVPMPEIRLRRPAVSADRARRVGVAEEDLQVRRAERESTGNSAGAGEGA